MTSSSSRNLRFLPLGLDVRGKQCVVIGGGSVGTRKVTNLSRAGALVTVVSPDLSTEVAAMVDSGEICWIQSRYSEKQLSGAFLVVAATDDEALNATIAADASQLGALVCDASSAERSRVIFGALHREADGTTVAVFTDGRDPAGARRTRDKVSRLLRLDSDSEAPSGSS